MKLKEIIFVSLLNHFLFTLKTYLFILKSRLYVLMFFEGHFRNEKNIKENSIDMKGQMTENERTMKGK